MASSDEEDYMSDKFLLQCQDTRPGLSTKASQQTKNEKAAETAKKKNTVPSKKKLEATQRETGLQTSISANSKGFALLQKMGYKPGTGIGKKGEGRLEPVPIEVKSGRSGLGKESDMKRKATEINAMQERMKAKRQRAVEEQKNSFLGRMSDKFTQRNTERDLRVAQKACFQLDKEQGIPEPDETFFWPLSSLPKPKEESGEEEEEEGELEELEGYQRTANLGLPENSDDDLDFDEKDEEEPDPSLDFSDFEKLEILTRYLRHTYKYCIWCGTRYEDSDDLKSNCPGNTSEVHD